MQPKEINHMQPARLFLLILFPFALLAENIHRQIKQITENRGWIVPESEIQVFDGDQTYRLSEFATRKFQCQHHRVRGGDLTYRFDLSKCPPEINKNGSVLEFEYPWVIKSVYAGGRELKDLSTYSTGIYARDVLQGRTFLLPPETKDIKITVMDFDWRFQTHFG
ncbi:MAG: hypothetical protein EOM73_17625, partial [Bacteroidia bacterium]|nr:hypothetical protein [Bacteroidia bacterium]